MQVPAYASAEDITRLNSDAQSLFDWCPIPLGSPLRVHAYSYRNWGIVITPQNLEWIAEGSRAAYSAEWKETDAGMNAMIGEACEKAGLLDSNAVMNAKIAEYAFEHICRQVARSEKPFIFRIMDVGAGAGGTSSALIQELAKADFDWKIGIMLTLIEPSEKRLEAASRAITKLAAGTWLEPALHLVPHAGSVDALRPLASCGTDMLITNAAIHHESFNPHLPEMLRVLKAGAPLVSGDWHEGTYESPARVYWMYYVLQEPHDENAAEQIFHFIRGGAMLPPNGERPELREFRKLYGLDSEGMFRAFDGLTESERLATIGSMRYWLEMAKRFGEAGKKSPEMLLQCHERVSKRIEALKNAGFVFDEECRSKYSELVRCKGYGELTAVMMAKKRAY